MFGWIRRRINNTPPPAKAILTSDDSSNAELSAQDHFQSDQPITQRAQDRFNRAPFASRIAETIAKRNDPSSIVIGLFGAWGDGKTSVLEMMQESLEEHDHTIVIRFNPWHFQSEELLLRGFFATLADGLGKSLPTLKEKAGDMFQKYGALLSLGSLTIGGVVQINPGEAAKGWGEALSTVGLADLKQRIDLLLAESRKRLIVLIDDIDRLDREETYLIFKLVKLSASFKHTCYVLAFDDDVVSAALGERYGAGGLDAGRAFLEKIIQVPLHLPPADNISLRTLAFEGVDIALQQAEISLDQASVDAFVRHFIDGLEPRLETPRLAKLYTNALSFALPLLKGEANIVDLMLIEGIRVFYPHLYAGIRDNPDIFLKRERENRRINGEQLPSPIDALLEVSLPGTPKEQREQIKDRLLRPLFPRVGNSIYESDWEPIWAADQKVCAASYFRRFFTYGVPDGDVSDTQINSFIANLASVDTASRRALLQEFVQRRAMPKLISILRQKADNMTQTEAIALSETLACNADLLPRERGPMIIGGTLTQAGILISQLARRVPLEQRQQVVEAIIHMAEPLGFAEECLRWVQHWPDRPEEHRVLPDESEAPLKSILAERIALANKKLPLYLQLHPKDAPSLYWVWNSIDNSLQVKTALEARFTEFPQEVDSFLDCFVGEGWELESGLPVRSSFDRRQYDSVAALVSAEYVAANLKRRYGAELEDPQYYPNSQFSSARQIAHQFIFVHNEVTREITIQSSPTLSNE